jgi:hypothetical protein
MGCSGITSYRAPKHFSAERRRTKREFAVTANELLLRTFGWSCVLSANAHRNRPGDELNARLLPSSIRNWVSGITTHRAPRHFSAESRRTKREFAVTAKQIYSVLSVGPAYSALMRIVTDLVTSSTPALLPSSIRNWVSGITSHRAPRHFSAERRRTKREFAVTAKQIYSVLSVGPAYSALMRIVTDLVTSSTPALLPSSIRNRPVVVVSIS